MQDFEKLGVFYLGRRLDPGTGKAGEDLILYDSKDLTTHAVIIGMTGSGKTGLGIGLIEEAAIDHIPVIAIDPKGDLGNLLLTFPDLAAKNFEPWVDPRAAAEAGESPAQFAAAQAAAWKQGLADWGQGPERIAALRAAADFALYTPGSTAGLPLSVLKAFTAPAAALAEDAELWRERLQGTVTGLLTLLGVTADPMTSREHILLSTILDGAWKQGQSPDVAGLIGLVQKPPFTRVGVLDLESFFPAAERQALALRLNNLLAAPGFDAWTRGEPLSADGLLFTPSGQPRVSVLSIAHLDDAQRMFFVTLLLAELIAWMRRQPGTPSLRAILYMDEVFGYMPPVANPPTKLLLLTLLKQARAFGLGVVLSTQNPVDLDYKGLANAGTWFIGRLQTERDKARVLEGLLAAAGGERLEPKALEQTLAGLGKRQFLLHNVNEQRPEVFATRWVMSYLAGPLTREQIRRLGAGRAPPAAAVAAATAAAPAAALAAALSQAATARSRPVLPAAVKQFFVPAGRLPHAGERLVYQPQVMAAVAVGYVHAALGINEQRELLLAAHPGEGAAGIDWSGAGELSVRAQDLEPEAEPDAAFGELPGAMAQAASYKDWERQLRRWLGLERALTLYKYARLDATSRPGESERDFRIRLQQLGNERRDLDAAKLKQKYAPKFATLETRELRARQARERQAGQASDAKLAAAVAVGTAVLGALFGRGRSVGSVTRASSAVRRTGSIVRESGDVARAEETLEKVRADQQALQAQFQQELDALAGSFDAQSAQLQEIVIRPKAADIELRFLGVGWLPYIEDGAGELKPA
ncbi:MAG: ATP-binding protein [Gammaproteobacteria bacterium]|nr:MAG: ATP-binding protein [Gammaproteobacteria bacterium]